MQYTIKKNNHITILNVTKQALLVLHPLRTSLTANLF